MNIYVDLDGVVFNTIQAIVDLYNMDFCSCDGFKEVKAKDINSYDFKELKLISANKIAEYFNSQRFFHHVPVMPHCFEVLNNVAYDNSICFVSIGDKQNLQFKMNWLKAVFGKWVNYDFVGLNSNKYQNKQVIDMHDGIIIDDQENNLLNSNAAYKICFGKQYPWNKNIPDSWRARDWVDVYYKIISCKEPQN